jgi:D-serine dehydratase
MNGSHDPTALAAGLNMLWESPISPAEKGFVALGPITPAELSGRGVSAWHAGFTMPLMVIREPALNTNVSVMARWCQDRGALLAPHAKTTMVPQIIAQQLRAGAWAITVATVNQLRALYAFGVRRFLIANQVTDHVALQWLAKARANDATLDVACYIDSEAGVRLLADAFGEAAPPMTVLLELGVTGGRTGVRGVGAARQLASYATATGLLVCGVAAFEGVLGHDRSVDAIGSVRALCREIRGVAAALSDQATMAGSGVGFAAGGIVSAGGSLFFDVVAEELADRAELAGRTRLVLRSGGYVVQDRGYLGVHSPLAGRGLEPAFETWAPVLSRPEPQLALLCAGKRDLPFDLGMPAVLGAQRSGHACDLSGARLVQLDDQHAYLALPPTTELEPGDIVRLGGAHPCTAFDKWRMIPLLDAQDRVVDVVRTLF